MTGSAENELTIRVVSPSSCQEMSHSSDGPILSGDETHHLSAPNDGKAFTQKCVVKTASAICSASITLDRLIIFQEIQPHAAIRQ
jgi:hypothetical protein